MRADMEILIISAKMPDNCFRCFASRFENYTEKAGFRCNLLPDGIVTNCEGREKRRENCPLVSVRVEP